MTSPQIALDAFGRTRLTLPPSPVTAPVWWHEARKRAEQLLTGLTLAQKIGQLNQVNTVDTADEEALIEAIRQGQVGSVINDVNPEKLARFQHVATTESETGIPLLFGRDVIHGFNTIFPLPLALACSWDEAMVEKVARYSAVEASAVGIHWTFSPMIDVSRDPRWGRIAESFGEDPLLNGRMGAAMIRGYQTDNPAAATAIAACAKHFAGYGASEGGKDYNTANISTHELFNVHLPAFNMAAAENVMTFMTSFSDLNGMPVSGNRWLLTDVLRSQWGYPGMVVSDWNSVEQLITHGIAANTMEAAYLALHAGVDMEMVSQTYLTNAPALVEGGLISIAQIDLAVLRVLTLKFALGLFDPLTTDASPPTVLAIADCAKQAALASCVLLKNEGDILPLGNCIGKRLAVFGFLADDPYEQLGTWIFDADISRSVTLMDALRSLQQDSTQAPFSLDYFPMMTSTRSHELLDLEAAQVKARDADSVIICVGEEAILSGEAHCRADIRLPGAQQRLIEVLAAQGTPTIVVVMAGRPLVMTEWIDKVDAVLYAWHPGTFAGPALADLLLGNAIPQGKLAVTFPRHAGQIPLYYASKPSGRPVNEDNYVPMEAFPMRAPQTSLGMATSHIDTHYSALFPFGFGLSYTRFAYSDASLEKGFEPSQGKCQITLSLTLTNIGRYAGVEIVQVYLRDDICSQSRPQRELVAYEKVQLAPGEQQRVRVILPLTAFAFYTERGERCIESGTFTLFVGPNSAEGAALTVTLEHNDLQTQAVPS